jgi:dihydroorotate dehydrogenase electron transfer subunit
VLVKIIENTPLGKDIYKLILEWQERENISPKPGQFLYLKVPSILLRRAFSIARYYSPNQVLILYKVIGRGTYGLTKLKVNDYLDVLGPLGKGLQIEEIIKEAKKIILVAGGIGIAGLLYLYDELVVSLAIRVPIILIQAAATKADLVPFGTQLPLDTQNVEVLQTTEDGSLGIKANAVEVLRQILVPNAMVFACGPTPMLKKIGQIYPQAFVAVEVKLGCGLGICSACSINTILGNIKLCQHGPWFRANELNWDFLL